MATTRSGTSKGERPAEPAGPGPVDPAKLARTENPEPAEPVKPALVEPQADLAPAPDAVRVNTLPPPPPPPVPEAKRKRGRPPGSTSKPKDAAQLATTTAPAAPVLPSDPAELDRVLAPYKVQATPYVVLVDSACTHLPPGMPLLPPEKDGLTQSIALVLHKYGGEVDPFIGLALMLAAIALPRYMIARQLAAAGSDPKRKSDRDPVPDPAPTAAPTAAAA